MYSNNQIDCADLISSSRKLQNGTSPNLPINYAST
uniref:Uncharacterized protein n=1 Tax=Arundo donax TaxID=35708 RepID=A0A0A9HK96_ARUDO